MTDRLDAGSRGIYVRSVIGIENGECRRRQTFRRYIDVLARKWC